MLRVSLLGVVTHLSGNVSAWVWVCVRKGACYKTERADLCCKVKLAWGQLWGKVKGDASVVCKKGLSWLVFHWVSLGLFSKITGCGEVTGSFLQVWLSGRAGWCYEVMALVRTITGSDQIN